MTEPSSQAPGHVDLATLTSGLHVLGVAPAWSAVERALGRLDSVRGSGTSTDDPKAREDLQTVHEFHQLLERSAETVALALLCGAVLGQASSAESFGEKLLAGLRAISRSYGFDRLNEAERRECLEELRRKLKAEGVVPKSVYGIPKPVKALDLDGWKEWSQKLRGVVEKTPAADHLKTELPKYRDRAWSLWKDRLAPTPRLERSTWPRVEPVLADLVCAAAGVSPGSLLDLDLNRMGLVEWSDVLFRALGRFPDDHRKGCPPWLTAPALYRLGFRPKVPSGALVSLFEEGSASRGFTPSLASSDWDAWLGHWERFLNRSAQPDRPVLLLIRQDPLSLTSSWKVAKRGGILALTQEQVHRLVEFPRPGEPRLRWVHVGLVVVEIAGDDPAVDLAAAAPLAGGLLYAGRAAMIQMAWVSSIPVSSALPVIYAPKNADDLIDRATPFLARPAS